MTNLEPLPAIILALAEQRSLNAVLESIVDVVSRQPGVALGRLWLRDYCPACVEEEQPGLHLLASAGLSSRTDGNFHHILLSQSGLKLAHIASTGESIRIDDLSKDDKWIRHPEWVRKEGLISFAGHPLKFRGEVLGVLAVFRRVSSDDECFAWLKTMASAAAVAIANARAFEDNEALQRKLEMERDYLREEVESTGSFGEILGRSPALERVMRQVELVALTDANVLVLGESGSGKELIARAIHQRSGRSKRALVKVNCGSIPHELFESEFFGHVRGSFTGAVRDRVGRFQLADGGTLFLDEVGEIPLDLQSKLLRVLQEGEFERVGDETTKRVNVRVVAATNRNLKTEIEAGRFRLDLYYRLGVFPIDVPSLRDRREDIPELVAHFAEQASLRFHIPSAGISHREIERAKQYDWPGNVRELQNVVERAVILARGAKLALDLPTGPVTVGAAQTTVSEQNMVIREQEWRERERANIALALKQADYKLSGKGGAAELLGVNPGTLASRMKAMGIRAARPGMNNS